MKTADGTYRFVAAPENTSEITHGRDTTVRHEMDDYGHHRLVINNTEGMWVGYEYIAECNEFFATTNYYEGKLPQIFTINEVMA